MHKLRRCVLSKPASPHLKISMSATPQMNGIEGTAACSAVRASVVCKPTCNAHKGGHCDQECLCPLQAQNKGAGMSLR